VNYRSFVESSNIDFKVNDHLIECGQDTWQIRNIAATSVGKKIIPLNEVEPKFEAAEPEFELNFSAAIVSSVIILYSLLLETNAGSKPLFYSFDEAQITKANNAIKRSMEKKETGDVQFKIETVNIGSEDSINNFGSSIYNQSIQR